jgi:hypothetical protein
MNARRFSVVLLLLLLSSPAMSGKHQPPPHGMIDHAYFKCEASRNLEGGIYGKGPFKRFGPEHSACSALEWTRISRPEFKQLATEWYGQRWENEIPFWSCAEPHKC